MKTKIKSHSNFDHEFHAEETGISVVICCYNSAEVLRPTLEHLANQLVPSNVLWEIIVVDNASTDGTGDIAEKIWQGLATPISFRVVKEEQAGLSAARKRGALESKYPILLFCDDDNWLCDSYVKDAYELMSQNEEIDMCGGAGEAVSDVELPDWFDKHYSSYAVGAPANAEGRVNSCLYGAGITVRKALLERAYELGFESLLTGRKGKQLTAGEDTEIAEWYAMFGHDHRYYLPSLKFKHFIAPNRLTYSHLLGIQKGFGKAYPILRIYKKIRQNKLRGFLKLWSYQVVKSFFVLCYHLVKGLLNGTFNLSFTRQRESFLWLALNRKRYYAVIEQVEEMRQVAEHQCQTVEPD